LSKPFLLRYFAQTLLDDKATTQLDVNTQAICVFPVKFDADAACDTIPDNRPGRAPTPIFHGEGKAITPGDKPRLAAGEASAMTAPCLVKT
jgi:hypothetical protein